MNVQVPESGSEPLPQEFQRLVDRAGPIRGVHARNYLEALLPLGISSYDQLAAALPALRDDALIAAVWALPYFDRRRTVPLAMKLLESPDPSVRGWTLVALEMTGGLRAVRLFKRHLEGDPDPWVREKAAHALGFLFDSRFDDMAFAPLLSALESQSEHPAVRAQAAESLGNILALSDRRTRRFKRAQEALIRTLGHPAPEVRFWSAFALGSMRSRAALPRLRHLVETDTSICPLWWSVKDEASDAIACILTGSWPEHERRMQR